MLAEIAIAYKLFDSAERKHNVDQFSHSGFSHGKNLNFDSYGAFRERPDGNIPNEYGIKVNDVGIYLEKNNHCLFSICAKEKLNVCCVFDCSKQRKIYLDGHSQPAYSQNRLEYFNVADL